LQADEEAPPLDVAPEWRRWSEPNRLPRSTPPGDAPPGAKLLGDLFGIEAHGLAKSSKQRLPTEGLAKTGVETLGLAISSKLRLPTEGLAKTGAAPTEGLALFCTANCQTWSLLP
jgi:hypothetical protein